MQKSYKAWEPLSWHQGPVDQIVAPSGVGLVKDERYGEMYLQNEELEVESLTN